MEGLILSGVAMGFAQSSRPASGLEHYFSHLWEMMALEQGQTSDLHGIQVAIGVNLTLWLLDKLLAGTPDEAFARRRLAAFDAAAWEGTTRRIFGGVADTILRNEATLFHKNEPGGALRRIQASVRQWPAIARAAREELPASEDLLALMRGLEMPIWPADIEISPAKAADALIGSREIRDKYLTSSLLWDLGLLETYAADLERMLGAPGMPANENDSPAARRMGNPPPAE
jgi:glycerol-1-phosphate dehydrogenase [NAD(P)+]